MQIKQDEWWERGGGRGYLNPIHCIMDDSGLCLLQSDRGGGGWKNMIEKNMRERERVWVDGCLWCLPSKKEQAKQRLPMVQQQTASLFNFKRLLWLYNLKNIIFLTQQQKLRCAISQKITAIFQLLRSISQCNYVFILFCLLRVCVIPGNLLARRTSDCINL